MAGMLKRDRLTQVIGIGMDKGVQGMTLPELASAMGLKKTAMIKGFADELVKKGYLVRRWDKTYYPYRWRYYVLGFEPVGVIEHIEVVRRGASEERTGAF